MVGSPTSNSLTLEISGTFLDFNTPKAGTYANKAKERMLGTGQELCSNTRSVRHPGSVHLQISCAYGLANFCAYGRPDYVPHWPRGRSLANHGREVNKVGTDFGPGPILETGTVGLEILASGKW